MHAEPIACFRPTSAAAATFAALPYDVFDRASAASYVAAHPTSFLAIDRPETAFGPEQDMYAPEVYAKAAELLDGRIADGTLVADEVACYYVWRMEVASHAQTGIVCGAAVDEYENGTIRRHENTRVDKQQDRIEHIRATSAQTGPIFLAYRDEAAIDELVARAAEGAPLYEFDDETGCHNTIWRVSEAGDVAALHAAFERVPAAYIADGHHRAASAVAVCNERRAQAPAAADGALAPSDLFLAVLFPANQLEILPYNRVVADTAGLSAEELLDQVRAQGFSVTPAGGAVDPQTRGVYGLFVGGQWYELGLGEAPGTDDPVAKLDTSIVQQRILSPVLGIDDPTSSPRITFVGGIRAAERAAEAAGAQGVAISLHPTSLDELMAVSDAAALMPPKSTWFEPKLLSGLFIRKI